MIKIEFTYIIVFMDSMLINVLFEFINAFLSLSSLKLYKYINVEDIRNREQTEIRGGKRILNILSLFINTKKPFLGCLSKTNELTFLTLMEELN